MKRNLLETGLLVLAILVLSSFSIRENPQDPPRGKKKERHINLVKIDDDGNRMELDTIIVGDDVFVWNGDTIGGPQEMQWISKGEPERDSLFKRFDMNFDINDDGHGRVFVTRSGKGGKHMVHEFKMFEDSTFDIDENVFFGDGDETMVWFDRGRHDIAFAVPPVKEVPRPPHIRDIRIEKRNNANVIDLSDPEIISFKKKANKDGTEKITIVRKQVNEEMENEMFLFHGGPDDLMLSPERPPMPPAHVRVFKSDDGEMEFMDNIAKGDSAANGKKIKVIEEDGKVIRIKEINKDGKKNVEVDVQVEKEDENY